MSRPPEVGQPPIRPEQLDARPYAVKPAVLQPWSRLWPFLHHVLGHDLPGRQIDVPRLVDQMARLRPVQHLPRRRRLAWAPQLHILVDGASAMDQFRADINALLDRLLRMRGSEGFQCGLLPFGPDAEAVNISPRHTPAGPPAGPEETVLILSDLGCFDHDRGRIDAWLRYGRQLQRRGVVGCVLSPCPRDRWDPQLTRLWRCAPWDRHERLPHGRVGRRPLPVRREAAVHRQMLEALLCACSVALRIESPLLRDLRLLLPGADAGLEHDLRNHPEVSAAAGLCALHFEHAARRKDELAAGDDEFLSRLKAALPDLLRRHHQVHGALLRARKTYSLHLAGLAVTDTELTEAQVVFQSCIRSRADQLDSTPESRPPTDPLGLASWNLRELARFSHAQEENDPELAAACAFEDLARGGNAEPPEHINRAAYQRNREWGLRGVHSKRLWQLYQRGRMLELRSPTDSPPVGTPVASVWLQLPSLFLDLRDETWRRFRVLRTDRADGRSCVMGLPRRISVASDSCQLKLVAGEVPPWVTRFGWDRFGLFADFAVSGVTFPLR